MSTCRYGRRVIKSVTPRLVTAVRFKHTSIRNMRADRDDKPTLVSGVLLSESFFSLETTGRQREHFQYRLKRTSFIFIFTRPSNIDLKTHNLDNVQAKPAWLSAWHILFSFNLTTAYSIKAALRCHEYSFSKGSGTVTSTAVI